MCTSGLKQLYYIYIYIVSIFYCVPFLHFFKIFSADIACVLSIFYFYVHCMHHCTKIIKCGNVVINQILVLILKRTLTSACKYKHTQGVFTGIKMGTAAPWIN